MAEEEKDKIISLQAVSMKEAQKDQVELISWLMKRTKEEPKKATLEIVIQQSSSQQAPAPLQPTDPRVGLIVRCLHSKTGSDPLDIPLLVSPYQLLQFAHLVLKELDPSYQNQTS